MICFFNLEILKPKYTKKGCYIPLRIASTGSNFEAEIAGIIPAIKPIKAAKPEPNNIFEVLKTNSKSNALDKTIAIIQTKNIPIKPPINDNITASKRN